MSNIDLYLATYPDVPHRPAPCYVCFMMAADARGADVARRLRPFEPGEAPTAKFAYRGVPLELPVCPGHVELVQALYELTRERSDRN
jgi:hypothetical protein